MVCWFCFQVFHYITRDRKILIIRVLRKIKYCFQARKCACILTYFSISSLLDILSAIKCFYQISWQVCSPNKCFWWQFLVVSLVIYFYQKPCNVFAEKCKAVFLKNEKNSLGFYQFQKNVDPITSILLKSIHHKTSLDVCFFLFSTEFTFRFFWGCHDFWYHRQNSNNPHF